jgi:ribosomal protein S18 acetylase RimI-like enzyme
VVAAAHIWAEATAARDGDPDVAPLDLSHPLIEKVIDSSARSLLAVARDAEGRALGFAAVEPLAGLDDHRASVRYLGVRPEFWGNGIAGELLNALRRSLPGCGFTTAELYVYTDNARAVRTYRRHGWEAQPQIRRHPISGRYERRYTVNVG